MLQYCTAVEHTVAASHIRQYARSTSNSQEDVLHLAVKQYKPRHAPVDGDVTIIACHASAFAKELYEPIWEILFARAESKPAGRRIRAIWIADVVNSGKSGVLNEDKLGNELSWFDHARDYLCVVNHFRQEMIRPIVGFGHSLGGNVIINLALMHPRLLTTVVSIEPAITKSTADHSFIGTYFLVMRKDRWPSRDAAMAEITRSPFYAAWDPKVLEIFKRECLRDLPTALYPDKSYDPTDTVTLTTSKHQEAVTYARKSFPESREQSLADFVPNRVSHPDLGVERNRNNAFYRPENNGTYQYLPFLRPSCFYIYGDKSHFSSASAQGREDKLEVTGTATGGSGGAAEGRVKDAVVKGSHFVPFEQPSAVAELTGQWLDGELESWHKIEDEQQRIWDAVPHAQRRTVGEDWMYRVREIWGKKTSPPGGKNASAKAASKL